MAASSEDALDLARALEIMSRPEPGSGVELEVAEAYFAALGAAAPPAERAAIMAPYAALDARLDAYEARYGPQ